eukprot:gb/GFBE01081800.1/.p1 GENE.gb/GFBE01081800.1/~~gb/GFBE01081800.1/.p1  ORF type:complete len:226 (+),score=87.42 gb/GFBE01081800.1/:1-678(+)
MFGISCGSTCKPQDPVTNTVKVNVDELAAGIGQKSEAEVLAEQRQQEQEAQEKAEEEERRLKAEEAAREAAIEAERRAEDERRRRQAEALRLREEEDARRMAEAAAAAAAEAAKKAEEERLRQEQAMKQRKQEVSAYLQKQGFADVNSSKRSWFSSTYPLHKAAEAADDKLVALLLEEGANASQKNSSGRTAAQVAFKKNRNGSHNKVLSLLSAPAAAAPRAGGA